MEEKNIAVGRIIISSCLHEIFNPGKWDIFVMEFQNRRKALSNF